MHFIHRTINGIMLVRVAWVTLRVTVPPGASVSRYSFRPDVVLGGSGARLRYVGILLVKYLPKVRSSKVKSITYAVS